MASTRQKKRQKRNRTQVVLRRWGDWRKVLLALLTGAVLAAILTSQYLIPYQVRLDLGEIADEDIFAPRYVRYPDMGRTQRLRELVAKQVPKSYQPVANADSEAQRDLQAILTAVDTARKLPGAAADRVVALRRDMSQVPAELAAELVSMPGGDYGRLKQAAARSLRSAMRRPIAPEALEEERSWARSHSADNTLAPVGNRLLGQLVALSLIPNQHFNEQETEYARKREMERVATQYEIIRRGDIIIRKGEQVREEHLTRLRALGLAREQIHAWSVLSLVLLAFGLVFLFSIYLYQFHPRILRSRSQIALIAVVVCGSFALFSVLSTALGLRFSVEQLGFIGMACSALGAMLTAALLCPQIAVFVGVALSLLTSLQIAADLRFVLLSIVSSLVAVQAVSNIRNRAGIVQAAFTVATVSAVSSLVIHGATAATPPGEWQSLGRDALWAVSAGTLSVVLFAFFAAYLERPFRLTTHLTLLELSDPSHPLLRRLQMEAPGTSHHSIIVGNLAEAAAEAIGADGLFCRVASLYHDVGKVIRPHFFVENQFSENRHDTINPSLSSLIVTSHVKDGVELAEEHRLPPSLIAIIREHHGTCLVKYFYHRAVTSGGEEASPGLEFQFRYEGPRPQSRESGIIMIADAVEAASRTLERPTPGRIRELIGRIVRDRLYDGQFDECELTFRDLEAVITSMTRSVAGLLHARVEYPRGEMVGKRAGLDAPAGQKPLPHASALSDLPEAAWGAHRSGLPH